MKTTLPKIALVSLLGLATAVSVAGCGSSDDDSKLLNSTKTPTTATETTATETTATDASDAATGTPVKVTLGEFYVKIDTESVKAGPVTFNVSNDGNVPHEFVVVKTDVAADKLAGSDGLASEEGKVGELPDVQPGDTDKVLNLDLKPGAYVLLCNVPGHYMAKQYVAFTVS